MDYKRRIERLLRFEMTEDLRARIQSALEDESLTQEDYRRLGEEMRRHRVLAAPRDQIDWHPRVDAARCSGCRICYEFCPKSVYEMIDSVATPVRPSSCVLLCSRCVQKCPSGAIRFPDEKDYRHFIQYR